VSELQSYERYNPTFVQDLIVYRGKKFLIHTIKDIWFEEAIETAKARRQFHAGFGSKNIGMTQTRVNMLMKFSDRWDK